MMKLTLVEAAVGAPPADEEKGEQRQLLVCDASCGAVQQQQQQQRQHPRACYAAWAALVLIAAACVAAAAAAASQSQRSVGTAPTPSAVGAAALELQQVSFTDEVAVGEPPFCPFLPDLDDPGCLENGKIDDDCCAVKGQGSCKEGYEYVQGDVCYVNGAVATCCKKMDGQAEVQPVFMDAPVGPASPAATVEGIFGWMVVMSSGGEAALVRDHFRAKRSIFACEDWSVFTDVDSLPPLPVTSIGSLHSNMASWGSWLNTEVFLRAWDALIREGTYQRRAWIVKSDADTVWFPERLTSHLAGASATDPMYIKNGGGTYLGSLEVFSQGAVTKFAAERHDVCKYGIEVSGEDGWISHCMDLLGVPARNENTLLKSDRNPGACGDGVYVAFHPFKDCGSFNTCYGIATR